MQASLAKLQADKDGLKKDMAALQAQLAGGGDGTAEAVSICLTVSALLPCNVSGVGNAAL